MWFRFNFRSVSYTCVFFILFYVYFYLFIYLLFIYLFIYLIIYSFIHSLTHSLTHSFIHSFIHLFIFFMYVGSVCCWLSPWSESFSLGTLVFLTLEKPTFQNTVRLGYMTKAYVASSLNIVTYLFAAVTLNSVLKLLPPSTKTNISIIPIRPG